MDLDKPARILVVDDEMSIVKLLVDIFQDENELTFATEGIKALEIAADVHPNLILLDVMMPDMDGFEVCRRLKQNPLTRHIPVIFITAHLDPAREIEGLKAGAVDYINKPINAALVHARVGTHLRLQQTLHQVHAFNATLENLVALRTDELKAALERLHRTHEELADSEARATLSTLIASVSHELVTPLSNSVITSDVLTKSSVKLLSDVETGQLKRSDLASFLADLQEGTNILQRNLQRARVLLDNFKQVAVDQSSERRREFDLATMMQEILATMAPTLRTKPHQVVLDIPAGIALNSYPGPLGQITINLINNAYLHAFEGTTDGRLLVRARQHDDEVWIHFEDNGIGIAQENLERIFEPFFTTRPQSGGTGLGMVIVRNLVNKSLHGTLNVESRIGVGTTVQVHIPLQAPLSNSESPLHRVG